MTLGADRSVFVTGAYGLLGGWLVKALLEQGARVTVLKRDEVSASALVLEGTERLVNVVHGDVSDAAAARARARRVRGRHGVPPGRPGDRRHGQSRPGLHLRDEHPRHVDNARGLPPCRGARTIVASSDKAYGAHDELPYRESLPLQPTFPYDVSKAAADLLARSYWHTFGLPVAVTRFANLYGGGDFNFSRLVPGGRPGRHRGRARR